MSDANPTPGPWYAIPCPQWAGARVRIDNRPDVPWANFGEIAYVSRHNAELIASAPTMRDELVALRTAAQAVVDRWHTPLWKDAEATGAVINRLERALESRK